MKHCILSKFIEEERTNLNSYLPDIKEIFLKTLEIDGVHNVIYHTNCIDRSNRYDLLIEIEMDKQALPAYDNCEAHRLWKEKYGLKLEKKAIFDFED